MYWKIVGTNVRMLGSMHLMPSNAGNLPEWVVDAYSWADVVYLESDSRTFATHMRSQDINKLQSHLSLEVWAALNRLWKSNAALPSLPDVKPWAAALIAPVLAQPLVNGVEPYFIEQAATQSKSLRYLETIADFVAGLESIPIEEAVAALTILMADLAEPGRSMKAMHAAWVVRDFAEFAKVVERMAVLRLANTRRVLLDDRNRNWVMPILTALESSAPTLIAVGVLHFWGRNNLLELLGQHVEIVEID